MAQINVKELNDYFKSKKTGSMELFFKYKNEEYALTLYLEKEKVSFQKISKENTDKEKYYYNINDLLNEEYINKEKLIDIFDKFNFYEEYSIEEIKKNIISKKVYSLSGNMLDGINVFINNKKAVYKYKLNENKITLQLKNYVGFKNLEVVYDENIYLHLNNGINNNYIDPWKFTVDLKKEIKKIIIIEFEINYKYFVKTVFKYINKFLDKDNLLLEMKLLKNFNIFNNYADEVDNLISEIDSKSIIDLLLEENNEYDRICKLLINSEMYKELYNKIDYKDKMLIITNYISCPKPFEVNQEEFNKLVESAIEYKVSLESVWRLAMSYDMRNLNYDIIDRFFIDKKDIWYLGEYISGVQQINTENIINLIINTKDIEYITNILNDEWVINHFNKNCIEKLKKYIEKS